MSFTKSECSKWLKNKEVNPRSNRPIQVGKGVYNKLEQSCADYQLIEGPSGRQSAKKKSDIFTPDECKLWLIDKTINPRSKRKIKIGGSVYKSLEIECKNISDTSKPEKDNKSPVNVSKVKSPVKVSKGKSPVNVSKVKSPVKVSKGKSPVKVSKGKSPVIVDKGKASQKTKIINGKIVKNGEDFVAKSITKTEVYNFLKNQYAKHTNNITNVQRPIPTQTNVLNLYTVEDTNVYYIRSESKFNGEKAFADSFGLRDWLLSTVRNYDGTKYRNPKFARNKGWMYFKNDTNKNIINRLQNAITITNSMFIGYTIIDETAPVDKGEDKKYGVIGCDIPFTEPKWLTDITGTGWDAKYNPSLDVFGSIKFNKCAISLNAAEKSIKMLRNKTKDGKLVWSGISPTFLFFPGGKTKLTNFLSSKEYNTVLIGWSGHARFGYKDDITKELYIYDPWKQTAGGKHFNEIKATALDAGYKTTFIKRSSIDQAMGEGSCVNVALMRAIMTSEYGMVGAHMDIPFEYAILAQRLISMKR